MSLCTKAKVSPKLTSGTLQIRKLLIHKKIYIHTQYTYTERACVILVYPHLHPGYYEVSTVDVEDQFSQPSLWRRHFMIVTFQMQVYWVSCQNLWECILCVLSPADCWTEHMNKHGYNYWTMFFFNGFQYSLYDFMLSHLGAATGILLVDIVTCENVTAGLVIHKWLVLALLFYILMTGILHFVETASSLARNVCCSSKPASYVHYFCVEVGSFQPFLWIILICTLRTWLSIVFEAVPSF